VAKYSTEQATDVTLEKVKSDWKPHLNQSQLATLEMELSLERPYFVTVDTESDKEMAVFDILSAGAHNKNLRVFFSPEFASHDGLTLSEVDTLSELLISIFLDMLATSQLEDVSTLSIYSTDILLITAFRGFANYLAQNGHCRVSSYGKWIKVQDINLYSEAVT